MRNLWPSAKRPRNSQTTHRLESPAPSEPMALRAMNFSSPEKGTSAYTLLSPAAEGLLVGDLRRARLACTNSMATVKTALISHSVQIHKNCSSVMGSRRGTRRSPSIGFKNHLLRMPQRTEDVIRLPCIRSCGSIPRHHPGTWGISPHILIRLTPPIISPVPPLVISQVAWSSLACDAMDSCHRAQRSVCEH